MMKNCIIIGIQGEEYEKLPKDMVGVTIISTEAPPVTAVIKEGDIWMGTPVSLIRRLEQDGVRTG